MGLLGIKVKARDPGACGQKAHSHKQGQQFPPECRLWLQLNCPLFPVYRKMAIQAEKNHHQRDQGRGRSPPWRSARYAASWSSVPVALLHRVAPCISSGAHGVPRHIPLLIRKGDNEPDMLYSDRKACMTSTRAARAAGSTDAMTAAASSTSAEPITGKASGMRTSWK